MTPDDLTRIDVGAIRARALERLENLASIS